MPTNKMKALFLDVGGVLLSKGGVMNQGKKLPGI